MQRAEGRLAAEVDEVIDAIEVEIDVDARRIHQASGWLWPSLRFSMSWLSRAIFLTNLLSLPGLGLRLAEVAAPASFDISTTRDGIMDVVGSDRAEVDLNHIYTAGIPDLKVMKPVSAPTDAMAFPRGFGDYESSYWHCRQRCRYRSSSLCDRQKFRRAPLRLPTISQLSMALQLHRLSLRMRPSQRS